MHHWVRPNIFLHYTTVMKSVRQNVDAVVSQLLAGQRALRRHEEHYCWMSLILQWQTYFSVSCCCCPVCVRRGWISIRQWEVPIRCLHRGLHLQPHSWGWRWSPRPSLFIHIWWDGRREQRLLHRDTTCRITREPPEQQPSSSSSSIRAAGKTSCTPGLLLCLL